MKKVLPIVLSAIIACIAAATLTACYIGNGGNSRHTHNYVWVDSGNGTHKQHCAVDGCNEPDINVGSHTFGADGKCVCGAEKPAEHKHAYTEEVIESKYLKTAATCETKAVYFYSCECGEKGTETFEYGDKLPHTFDKQVVSELYIKSSATCAKKAEYYYSCACGEKGTETFEYGDKLPHTFDKQVVSDVYIKSSATCMTKAEYYYSCACGEKGTETFVDEDGEFSTEVHPYEDVWYNDEQFHYHKSSCSHAVVKDKTAHSFGENETCTVCGCRKTSTGLRFTYNSDYNGYILTGIGTCKDLDIIVPSAYNEKPVVGIDSEAFSNSSITSIIIPDSVSNIRSEAFLNCTRLTNVTIGNGVVYISIRAFSGCSSLKDITIPDSVKEIGDDAFLGCSSLKNVTINGITKIGWRAFFGCNQLKYNYYKKAYYLGNANNKVLALIKTESDDIFDCEINENCKIVGSYAFSYCENLTNIIIPDNVMILGTGAFYGCKKLSNVTIGSGITQINGLTFRDCVSLKQITIPSKATYIGYFAFGGCERLDSIVIPENVETIVTGAFSGCVSLKKVTLSNKLTRIESSVFSECCLLDSITIPNSVTNIERNAFKNCTALTTIVIPDSVTEIGEGAFKGCSSLESITLPFIGASKTAENGYDQVFGYIFGYHTSERNYGYVGTTFQYRGGQYYHYWIPDSLKTVIITNNVTSINSYAFNNCNKLINITLPDNLTQINYKAFSNCTSLKNITFPNGVTYISGFDGCTSLENIIFPEGVITLGSFEGCTSLKSVIIPDSVTILSQRAFFGCSNLKDVVIGNGVTQIGECTFFGCSELMSVTIGSSITKIEDKAFYGCYRLVQVINRSKLNKIEKNNLYGYVGYYSLSIENEKTSDITYQGDYAFFSSEGVNYLINYFGEDKNLTLPKNYNGKGYKINRYAFYGRVSVEKVIIPDNILGIGEGAFNLCSSFKYNEDDNGLYVGTADNEYFALIKAKSTDITSCFVNANCKIICDEAFYGVKSLESVIIADGVRIIGNESFRECRALTSISIPNSVIEIGYRAFSYCYGLTDLIIPDSVKNIGFGAFWYCTNLRSIELPFVGASLSDSKNTHFGYIFGAESYRENRESMPTYLTSAIITGGEIIGDYAFYQCRRISSINLPCSINVIGKNAFSGCTSLKKLTYDGTIEQWNNVSKGTYWNYNVSSNFVVNCIDGNFTAIQDNYTSGLIRN